jgi:hypothetical protein
LDGNEKNILDRGPQKVLERQWGGERENKANMKVTAVSTSFGILRGT